MKAGQLKTANVQITLNVILSSLRWIYNSELYDNTCKIGQAELERTIIALVFKGVDLED